MHCLTRTHCGLLDDHAAGGGHHRAAELRDRGAIGLLAGVGGPHDGARLLDAVDDLVAHAGVTVEAVLEGDGEDVGVAVLDRFDGGEQLRPVGQALRARDEALVVDETGLPALRLPERDETGALGAGGMKLVVVAAAALGDTDGADGARDGRSGTHGPYSTERRHVGNHKAQSGRK